jgi:hypothetical protein
MRSKTEEPRHGLEGSVLVIKRIHVHLLTVGANVGLAMVERVHVLHADKCPVACSTGDAIAISTEVATVPE